MSIHDHSRFKVVSETQHLYEHSLDEFAYSHPALPGNGSVKDAFDYVLNVLYPRTLTEVATPADLPTGVDTPNIGDAVPTQGDQRLVVDDGDGKYAMYQFAKWDDDVVAIWHKIADIDFGVNGVVQGLLDQTQYLFARKYGTTDYDQVTELALTGDNAGQHIYGGDLAGQNLVLHANNGDAPGLHTGHVFIDDDFSPLTDLEFNNGEANKRWLNGYFGSLIVGTASMTITSDGVTGLITDTNGVISFDDENLITTGNFDGSIITASNSLVVNDTVDQLTISIGSILSTTGAISFGDENLATTGTLASGQATILSDLVLAVGSITSVSGAISFGDEVLTTTGDLNAAIGTLDRLLVDDLILDGSTISTDTGAVAPVNFESYDSITYPPATFNANPNSGDVANIDNARYSVRFIPAVPSFLTTFSIYALPRDNTFATLTNGQLVAELYSGNAVEPSAVIATSTNSIDAAIWSGESFGSVSEKIFNFANIPLTGGADYWVSIRLINNTQGLTSNIMVMGLTVGPSELYPPQKRSTNGGLTWNLPGGTAVPVLYKWTYETGSVTDLNVSPTGIVNVTRQMNTIDTNLTGLLNVVGSAIVDSITLDNTAISVVGDILTTPSLISEADGARDIGAGGSKYANLFLGTSINNGTEFISMTELMALNRTIYRDVAKTQPAQDGDMLLYNGASSKFLASTPGGSNNHIATYTDVQLATPINVSADMDDARDAIFQLWEVSTGDLMAVPISVTQTLVSINNTVPLPAGNYKLIGIQV